MKALLVDPGLFTAPYDAALSAGLANAGVNACWVTRALRANEEADLPAAATLPIFYPLTDGPRRRQGKGWQVLKGVEHIVGLTRMTRLAAKMQSDVVHLQWSLVPRLDVVAIRRLRRQAPVSLTVHDTTPFNGKAVSRLQREGWGSVLATVDRLIVHGEAARDRLVASGIAPERVAVIPHGPLGGLASGAAERRSDGRWRIVLAGRLQAYKGVDLLVEAVGRLAPAMRAQIEVIVAGEPMIPVDPLTARAQALGLDDDVLRFRFGRLPAAELDGLLRSADAFVFPYREIDASGVLFSVAGLRRWIVASDMGAFATMIGHRQDAGELVPPGDVQALADGIARSIGREPTRDIAAETPDWDEIGRLTREVYVAARESWEQAR